MSSTIYPYQKRSFEDAVYARPITDYSPMRATNPYTGKLQEVVLIEPRRMENAVAVNSFPELHADLNKAFSQFNRVQQRVLFRVLVQGQSIETATIGLLRTRRWWAGWFRNTALPKLQKALADYVENGKLVIG